MRSVIVSVFLFASTASAGTHDALLQVDGCWDNPATQIALPEADGIRPGGDFDDSVATLGPGDEVQGSGQKGDGPAWCATITKVTIGGQSETLLFSGIYYVISGEETSHATSEAAQWAVPVEDADALAAAKAGTLAVPVVAADGADLAPDVSAIVRHATTTKKLAALAASQVIVVGSAEGQIWKGAKAKKTLGKWNLDLAIAPAVTSGQDKDRGIAWVFANVTATPHKGGTAITYRVLYGLYLQKKKWKLGLVHFAVVK